MQRNAHPLLIGMALLFGIFIGGLGLGVAGWKSGVVQLSQQTETPSSTAYPGMAKLDAYQCKRGETKQIILGGIEDNYQAGGENYLAPEKLRAEFTRGLPMTGSIAAGRAYDEAGQDKQFLASVTVPPRIMRGLFVVRSKPTAGFENDIVKISHWSKKNYSAEAHWLPLGDKSKRPQWRAEGDILSVAIEDIIFFSHTNPAQEKVDIVYPSLTALSQTKDEPVELAISIGDDRNVDFFGFAVCTAPDRNKGVTYTVRDFQNDPSLTEITCASPDKTVKCNTDVGNTSCNAALPLACFRFTGGPTPDSVRNSDFYEAWSAGALKFTTPISGKKITSQDAAHMLCKREFGEGFRTANIHDGFAIYHIIARGKSPDASAVWIESKDEPYANCWPLRDDYPDTAQPSKTPAP